MPKKSYVGEIVLFDIHHKRLRIPIAYTMEVYANLFGDSEQDTKKLLDQVQQIRNKTNTESDRIALNLEIQYLINAAKMEQAMVKIPPSSFRTSNFMEMLDRMQDLLFDSKEGHFCESPLCQFVHFEKGAKFKPHPHMREYYVATGTVYVCKNTAKVHICGADKCDQFLVTGKSEGYTCKISGIYFGQVYRATSFGDSRKDGSSGQGTESYDNQDYDDDGVQIIREEVPSVAVDDYYGSLDNFSSSEYGNSSSSSKSRGRHKGVQAPRLQFKKPRKPSARSRKTMSAPNNIKLQSQKRSNERSHAREIITQMFGMDRMSGVDLLMNSQEKKTNEDIEQYYELCEKTGKPMFLHEVHRIISKNMHDAFMEKYRSTSQGGRLIFENETALSQRDYFLEAVLSLWEIVSSTPYAREGKNTSRMKFQEMVVTLMYVMKCGLTIKWCVSDNGEIYPTPDAVTFRQHSNSSDSDNIVEFSAHDKASLQRVIDFFDDLPEQSGSNTDPNKKIYLLNLTVIPKHATLGRILPDEQHIRNIQRNNNKTSPDSQKSYAGASPMHGKKELLKCYHSIADKSPHISSAFDYILASKIPPNFLT